MITRHYLRRITREDKAMGMPGNIGDWVKGGEVTNGAAVADVATDGEITGVCDAGTVVYASWLGTSGGHTHTER